MSRGTPISVIALALALAIPAACEARPISVKARPLQEFLNAQGTATSFFAHPDISGWVDKGVITFGLVDYPGVIAKWLREKYNIDLGTTVTGSVYEWALTDGRARVAVMLRADNALGFAQATGDLIGSGFDWEGTAEVFGKKASEVAAGATPALGYTQLSLGFVIQKPGAPLPNIQDILKRNTVYDPVSISLTSRITGTDAEGHPATLLVHQAGESAGSRVAWSSEVVEVEKLASDGMSPEDSMGLRIAGAWLTEFSGDPVVAWTASVPSPPFPPMPPVGATWPWGGEQVPLKFLGTYTRDGGIVQSAAYSNSGGFPNSIHHASPDYGSWKRVNDNQVVFTMTHFDLDSSTGALVNVSKTKGTGTFAEGTDDVISMDFQTDIYSCGLAAAQPLGLNLGCDLFENGPAVTLVGSGIARRIPVEAPEF